MIYLVNKKLVSINEPKEDYSIVTATKLKEHISKTAIRDRVYTLKGRKEGYIFICTQSPFNDNSGLGTGIDGYHDTIGNAINSAKRHAYIIKLDNIDMVDYKVYNQ